MEEALKRIEIKGARVHNLKGVDVSIPWHSFSVVTGVSGSGKSSLAFDTLFAEGYRKYMDSLSTRARQLLDQLPKPEVDSIHGLTPVIAIEQRTGGGASPRSTVATITEIADFGRLLWSVAGVAYCPLDGGRIIQRSLDDNLRLLMDQYAECRMQLLAPYMEAKASVIRGELDHLRQKGYQRIRVNGEIIEVDGEAQLPKSNESLRVELVIDRIVIRSDQRSRMADSLELAFREGKDRAIALLQESKDAEWKEVPLSQHLSCEVCGTVYPQLTPKHFSWDHPAGACEVCGGVGDTMQFSEDLLVPDPSLSVRKGAIKGFRLGSRKMIIEKNALMKQLAEQYPFDAGLPWSELPPEVKKDIIHGTGERQFLFKLKPGNRKPEEMRFNGVLYELEKTRRETSSEGLKARLTAFQIKQVCPECNGKRLNKAARAVLLSGMSYPDFLSMTIRDANQWVSGLDLMGFEEAIKGLKTRLHFLNEVGLGYLRLDRLYSSLSGGESQRVRLATQLGMGLSGVTYVLDEPTVGLHPANTKELIQSLEALRQKGNTIVVVEHDADVIRHADHLVEIGPGAGTNGGHLIYEGSVERSFNELSSKTGGYLGGSLKVDKPVKDKLPSGSWITIEGAREHNLKNIDVSFPAGLLTVVTGVSGSGKSTLVNDILAKAAAFHLNRAKEIPGTHSKLSGLDRFERVVRVSQEPIGRSPRSNAATYTKILDDLRKVYAQTSLAKVRGYGPGRFSFNVRGGRCERCQGDGAIKLDMQFLSDVYQVCPACEGKRYNRETLEVRFKGHSIADVLEMSVSEALEVFQRQPSLYQKLETLKAVGLGYLSLGQAAPTLSGGEAQRLKLALELSKGQRGESLYILDEPSTGLHWEDIQHLVDLLYRLREKGHTLVCIEHNLDIIRLADWVIDLGPGGGEEGGELLFAGSVDELMQHPSSQTAIALTSC